MAAITAQMVKELRERTGAGVKECKDILEQTQGNLEQAIEELRKRGLRVSEKVAGREAKEGRIEIYVHHGSRVAAMVELNCETDFVARTEEFVQLGQDLARQVAAMNPRYIRVEDVPAEAIAESGLTPEQYAKEYVLLMQGFIKEPSLTIEDKIKAVVAKIRENVVVRRFVRYELGA